MKRILSIFGAFLLLLGALTGCAAKEETVAIQAQYGTLATAQMTAEVTAHLSGESRTYTLSCDWDTEKAATTVIAPEELAGITAELSPDGLSVSYDGTAMSAGNLSDICPANCLPYLLSAIADGYLLDESRETWGEVDCYRLHLDTTAASGKKVECTVWIDEQTLLPRYAEFAQDEQVVLTVTMQEFQCTVTETPSEEEPM